MRSALCAFVTGFVLSAATASVAQPPDRLDHYRVVPQRSVYTEQGGFAGFDARYRVRGEFDFLQEWSGGTPTEPYRLTARFDNADLRAPVGPALPAFIDVDQNLNLEGLRGRLLPLGAPFDVYHFTGYLNEGVPTSPLESSTVDLYTALVGPWMYLYAETTPPAGGADFIEYGLQAVARKGRWADWNEDGIVDAADYSVMRDELSRSASFDWGAERSAWEEQFGEQAPDADEMNAMFAAAMSSSLAIPEPSCVMLALIGAVGAVRRR